MIGNLFTGGMAGLTPLVGAFHQNITGYPWVPVGSAREGWRRETLEKRNITAFLKGMDEVLEDSRTFHQRSHPDAHGDVRIPDTPWRLRLEGEDRLTLFRPRSAIIFDRDASAWTDILEIRKEYSPAEGGRRFITQKIRCSLDEKERLREVKVMQFTGTELHLEFGRGNRALTILEHQLMMQYHTDNFQPVAAAAGMAKALSPREPVMERWSPPPRRTMKPESIGYDDPTPPHGFSVVDPDYPHRAWFEFDPAHDSYAIYLSVREPGSGALALDIGLRTLWERIETYVETTDRVMGRW